MLESEETTGLVLQLQELGLPSAFGTSKARISVMHAALMHVCASVPESLMHLSQSFISCVFTDKAAHQAAVLCELLLQAQETPKVSAPAFGHLNACSQGEAYNDETESCCITDSQQHHDPCDEEEDGDCTDEQCMQSAVEQSSADQVPGIVSEWQQAYDDTYGCFYYYRQSTQVLTNTQSAFVWK